MTPDANDLCVFAVKRGYIESKEIYCNPLYPTYLSLVEKYQHSPYANGILNNHVAVNPKTDCSLLSDSSEVSFVPMANVQEKTNVVSYDMVAYETVKKGFTVFQRGDLIWAKITPCMQNGKSCIVDKMPTEIGFGSTEFHVIRKRNENVYMPFIWAILSSDDVLKAAQATFSGSAGQQRVSASFIENFPAVLPDYPVQVRLVAELEDKLNLLNGKLQRAYELLHKTPMYLIDRLGLTFDFSATQKITYATTVANIEGRIDADYYSPKFSHFRSQIEALPYRTVSVDDISEKIVSGFAAGKQDQADNLPEDQRVPHLRPFSITPEQKSSKKLFEDGHFANAAEDAFIELNSRAKAIYKKLVPSAATVPDGTDLMHKLFGSNPLLCPVRDTGTESGNNYQQGFHFMTAGAMSALRNPKAHSNDEVLTAEEALRRLMFASMLMYKLDEAGL